MSSTWELFNMINPINHGLNQEEIKKYKVEPYVVAADVYSVKQHSGRGGWTWYTGSAGWMYRLIVESILGLRIEGGKLSFIPCIPAEWDSFTVDYKYQNSIYHIKVMQAEAGSKKSIVTIDGEEKKSSKISLVNDEVEHWVEIKVPIGTTVAEQIVSS